MFPQTNINPDHNIISPNSTISHREREGRLQFLSQLRDLVTDFIGHKLHLEAHISLDLKNYSSIMIEVTRIVKSPRNSQLAKLRSDQYNSCLLNMRYRNRNRDSDYDEEMDSKNAFKRRKSQIIKHLMIYKLETRSRLVLETN